jgi:hypothetical protein
VAAIEAAPYSLCRFNVAMTRDLRRGKKRGAPESKTNGRYYPGHQIPIARTEEDKSAMLAKHLPLGTMIEVLVHGDLKLPHDTSVICYSDDDSTIARNILNQLRSPWVVEVAAPPGNYPRSPAHSQSVEDFIAHALKDPAWRGNGLEFDRLR